MTVRFDAVLFDAGGVLVLPDPTVIGPLLAPYGADGSLGSLRRAHYAGMHALDTQGRVHDDWDAYNPAYVRAAGVPEVDVDEAAFVLGRTRSPWLWRWPIPEAVAVLRELAGRDVPMGVVSNASGQITATLRRFGVCQVGDGPLPSVRIVVDSHTAGVEKPDPRIFDDAVEAMGVAPERIAYVGDSVLNDVAGATAAGLVPLHLDPFDDHPDATHERIAALDDLLGLVTNGS